MTYLEPGVVVEVGVVREYDFACYADIGQCEDCLAQIQVGDRVWYTGEHFTLRLAVKMDNGQLLYMQQQIPKIQHLECPA